MKIQELIPRIFSNIREEIVNYNFSIQTLIFILFLTEFIKNRFRQKIFSSRKLEKLVKKTSHYFHTEKYLFQKTDYISS